MITRFVSPVVWFTIRHHCASGRTIFRAFAWMCAWLCALGGLLTAAPGFAQVITIDNQGRATDSNHPSTVDRRFAQIEPTKVDLSKAPMNSRNRQEIIRTMQSEQGFAMRPFPKGHKGLNLVANGKLEPAGESYLDMVTKEGTSARPGDRLVLTDVKIKDSKIIFDLNGGPDAKHRFLRHIEVGTDPVYMNPVIQDGDADPTGARLTLDFKGHIPELTGAQVKALLAPLISFDVKTPIQAFTDTLPPQLKEAILNHRVLVGMSTQMVLFAMGQPWRKVREMDGQMPFEEWIYGRPPQATQFVRINGNRVIRVEIAAVGKPPQIFDKDEVEGLMRTDGTPVVTPEQKTRTVALGDTTRNPDTQAPAPSPTLRNPGESLPQDQDKSVGTMRPVRFPKQQPDDYPDASRLPRQKPSDQEDQPPAADGSQPAQPDAAKPDAAKPDAAKPDQNKPAQTDPSKPAQNPAPSQPN
jgi:hypothetical protein